MMDAFADSAHRYFSGIVHDNDQLSRLVKATPYFVNSEAPNEETCQILLGGSISPEKGLCAHIEYTKNLKTAHAILDVLKNIIFYYEIEHMSSSSQAEAIKELSEKNGLSTRILTDFANKGRIYREIFIRAGPGDLAFLSDHKHMLVLSLTKLIFANPFLVGREKRILKMFDFSSTFGVHSIPSKKRRSGDLTQSWEA
jgi:hypothetical protein